MAKGLEKKSGSKFIQTIKKRWVLIAMCLGIISTSYVVLFRHYQGYRVGQGTDDIVYRLESKLLDWRFHQRGAKKPRAKVGILAIDEKSIQQFGRWPFSRRYYARALDNLKKAGVKWVGFDAVFSEPEQAMIEDLKQGLTTSGTKVVSLDQVNQLMQVSPADRMFAEGIQRFGNLVQGYFFLGSKYEAEQAGGEPFANFENVEASASMALLPDGRTLAQYDHIKQGYYLVSNTPAIASASIHSGYFANDADNDAINRWGSLLASVNGQLLPSLSLKIAAEYLDRDVIVMFDGLGIENIMLPSRKDETDVIEVPVDPLGSGRMLINHLGPSEAFPHFSLADAYNDTFTPKQREYLKGGLLLLGMTAVGINDIRPNSFDAVVNGVENHAAMVHSILTKNFLKRSQNTFAMELMIVIGVGLLFAPLMIWGRAAVSGIAVVAFLVGYYYFDKHFWFSRGVWAYMGVPCLEVMAMFVTTTLYKYMTEEAEKKKVKGAFQFYLSPDVINQIMEDPSNLKLGGEKKELTVFFSDVRSFTTISESLTPEKLCELMNEYFTPMTSIILRSKGVLDKYIGDAIMAFWGAPIEVPNHADVAAQACLEMLVALDRLREEFPAKGFPKIDIGMGLNTGLMSVGNMGSGERFTYTVMGDSVNLGSRLEGLTKEYGIKAMISEYTHAKLTPQRFFTRDLDDIRVKGKNEPVKVFELMRPNFMKSAGEIREFIGLFEEGRKFYKVQDWERAYKQFFQCLQMKPDDKAAALYVERIEEYRAEAPGESWDGVYTFKHK